MRVAGRKRRQPNWKLKMNTIFVKQTIELAIKDQRWLKIDYVSKKKLEITNGRIVEPMQIKKDSAGVPNRLVAHCYLRNDLRTFDFDGIQKIEIISPTGIMK